ncbi:MAG: hypothetical protein HYW86_05015 [Candidatus Roizmanbacteria bacterium]|nr:MAG: hypothetical protein HYW86_05015 [Candidatus Roizmanbacteria bacterium]
MDLANLVKNIEIELLKLIVLLLKTGAMRVEEVRTVAKDFLSFLPFQNHQALVSALKVFTEKHNQFISLYQGIVKINENKKINELIAKMRLFTK